MHIGNSRTHTRAHKLSVHRRLGESNREIKEFLCWGWVRETVLLQSLGLAAPTCPAAAQVLSQDLLAGAGVLRKWSPSPLPNSP